MCDMEFFLGGQDLEMQTIRELLEEHVPGRLHDKRLAWGARASHYREEIKACLARERQAVLVELEYDLDLRDSRIVLVDHHGHRADGPTSLHQVFALLGLPRESWTRWFDLVAANDAGYIPAMQALGATQDEIVAVRAADRRAQGISEVEEKAGEAALRNLEQCCDGDLTIVSLPHGRTAVVTDRLEPALGGPGYRNLLVISPSEVNFYGERCWIGQLDQAFPGGWSGQRYWGHALDGGLTPEAVVSALEGMMQRDH